MEEEEESIRFP